MDILYQLPFPQEICSKIFMFACKSPHTGLSVAILKKIIGLPIYKKLIEYRDLDKQLKIALLQGGARIAVTQNEPVIASRWNLEASKLKSPPTPKPTNKK